MCFKDVDFLIGLLAILAGNLGLFASAAGAFYGKPELWCYGVVCFMGMSGVCIVRMVCRGFANTQKRRSIKR
jgi:hypothetical protein